MILNFVPSGARLAARYSPQLLTGEMRESALSISKGAGEELLRLALGLFHDDFVEIAGAEVSLEGNRTLQRWQRPRR